MSELNIDELPQASSFGGALQQYAFSGPPPTPSPSRRVTRGSSSAASTPPSASTATVPFQIKAQSSRPSSSATNKKRKRESSSYAPPSKYAHLPNLLTDTLRPSLICVFIGVNPGLRTASSGHAYAHPSNLFWKLLHSSGCTPRLCKPSEDRDLPKLYALGNTNIVARATKDASELSKREMDEGVAVLEEKCRKWRPESVCVVGKGIWESVWRVRHTRNIKREEFKYGWQDDEENMGVVEAMSGEKEWAGARVFVATTTSGLAAGMRPHEKEEIWRGLGEWVAQRRREKGIPDEGEVKDDPDLVKEEEDEKAQCSYAIKGF